MEPAVSNIIPHTQITRQEPQTMKNLFNLDNPVFQFLTRIADLVICHFLCLFCCLPIVTAGASFTALAKTVQGITRQEMVAGTSRTFLRAFRDNFKQATLVWLCALLAFAAIACDYSLMKLFVAGTMFTVLTVLLVLLLFLVLSVLAYIFPLMARYENTLREHLQNAIILAISKLPKTILMVFVHVAPILLALFFVDIFVYTMPFWIFIGFGFSAQVDAMLLNPVFQKLEEEE